VGGGEQCDAAESGEFSKSRKQPQRLPPRLPKVEPRIDDHAVARDPVFPGQRYKTLEGSADIADNVLVHGIGIGCLRPQPYVGCNYGGAGRGRLCKIAALREAAHVVS
jgi:hypothetical protein